MALFGKTPTITNLTLTDKDTEYSHTVPNGTKKYIVQCRTDKDLKLAYVNGESGSTYWSIPEGASHSEDNLNTSNLVLYLQSPTDGVVAEITTWTT